MSEADTQNKLQKDPAVGNPAPPPPPLRNSKGRPSSNGSNGGPGHSGSGGKVLASLAILIGLAGAGAAGYTFWLQQGQLKRINAQQEQIQKLQGISQQAQQLASQERQLTSRLDRFPSVEELDERRRLLATLQSEQQRLSTRVERVLGASREDWRLAEAEHLLRMAMLRLSAMQDVKSAIALLNESDLILQKQDDPGAYAAREKLMDSLEALRSLPNLDRTGLFLQLGALRGLSSQLTAMAPQFHLTEAKAEPADETRWQHWLNEVARYVRIDLDAVNNVKPLLAGQSLGQVRLALALAIEQAQWAVLNGNTEIYQQSLGQAHALLADYFNADDLESKALAERIQALSERQITATMPDLTPSLRALEAYIAEREKAAKGVKPEEGEKKPKAPVTSSTRESRQDKQVARMPKQALLKEGART